MKIGIIADIHSNMYAFEKVLEELDKENINEYIFLGDYILDGFDNTKTLKKVKSLSENVVYGNKEEFFINTDKEMLEIYKRSDKWKNVIYGYNTLTQEDYDYIKQMAKYKVIEIEGNKICFFHSMPYGEKRKVYKDSFELFDELIKDFNCDIYLMGHTHVSFYTEYRGKIFINPGTVGMPIADGPEFRYGILDINKNEVKYEQKAIKYDYEELKKYLTSKDWHLFAHIWAELSLSNLKYSKNYTQDFTDFVKEEAKKRNIDIEKETPNWFYNEMYAEFRKVHPEIEEIIE